jgi:preprotein translocase subunit SecG
MEWLVQLADWLEMVVVWMAAIFAVLALVLSIYNTFALRTLRRELEDPREEALQSPTENAEPMEENYPARST